MNQWRNHPKLQGLLNPEYPDDLQVLVHDGGPRVTDHSPELIWVRVADCVDSVFTGTALNQPEQLSNIQMGADVTFIIPDGGAHPILVTDKYLKERADWIIHPCDACGFSELFDAPSDLIRLIFPNLPEGASPEMFTSFCALCGGVQAVEQNGVCLDQATPREETPKKWWQIWK